MIQKSHQSRSWAYRQTVIQKDTCIPVLIAALFTIAKTWKQPKCPLTHEWIKKPWYINTIKYYSSIKKKKKCHCSNMDATWSLILSAVSQKEMKTIWYHLYVESKIQYKSTYLWNRNRFTDLENRLVVAKGEEEGVVWTWSLVLVDANYCIWSG